MVDVSALAQVSASATGIVALVGEAEGAMVELAEALTQGADQCLPDQSFDALDQQQTARLASSAADICGTNLSHSEENIDYHIFGSAQYS